jgi:hypothetical protein
MATPVRSAQAAKAWVRPDRIGTNDSLGPGARVAWPSSGHLRVDKQRTSAALIVGELTDQWECMNSPFCHRKMVRLVMRATGQQRADCA